MARRSTSPAGYDGIDDRAYEPLVHLEMAGNTQFGWVHVPGETDRQPPFVDEQQA